MLGNLPAPTSVLAFVLGAGAIGYWLGNDNSHPAVLVGGLIALLWGSYWWFTMRRLYGAIAKVYEAELEAADEQE